jgi:sphinganine-1-phosphate aldolase
MRARLPEEGRSWSELEKSLRAHRDDDADWRNLRTALYIFNAGEEAMAVAHRAYTMFIAENGLGAARAFPSLRRMEREVLDIGLDLLNAPDGADGSMTSGGTESIFLAVKSCREYWRAHGRDISNGNLVIPFSAHPAFNKAAGYLGLSVIRVGLGSDLRADVTAMTKACDDNTLMIVGSAPCFPFGLIDPIEELSALALERKPWLHVDACVGGYFAPFARANGENLEPYDFLLEGVGSISADLHKYGYAAKGASSVFYRNPENLVHQRFEFDDWPCGPMVTPTFAGTRPGGAIAAAWAVLQHLGEAGYRDAASKTIEARRRIEAGLARLGGFHIHGQPRLGLICFGHDSLDIQAVGDALAAKGWIFARTRQPQGLHLMLSPAHLDFVDEYLADLELAVADASAGTGPNPTSSAASYYN